MLETNYKHIIEAALFASQEPLDIEKIKRLFDDNVVDIKLLLQELQNDYQDRGVELVKVASGYRFQAKQIYAAALRQLYDKNPPRYSRALLETLVLIAYRQPMTRGEIEDIRGVAVNPKIMKILQEREWIKVVGQKDVPGKPALFATTKQFLDYFNLTSLNDLPPLQELMDLDQAEQQLTQQLSLAVNAFPLSEALQEEDEFDTNDIEHPNQEVSSDPS